MVISAVEAGHFSFSINFWLVQTYMTRFEPITVIRRYIPTGTLFLFSPLFHIINLHVASEYEWIKKYFITELLSSLGSFAFQLFPQSLARMLFPPLAPTLFVDCW